MRIFLIGAGGGVGRRLVPLLVGRGVEVSGMFRRSEQATEVASAGATPVHADLMADSVADLAQRLSGHDAVVFSAGAHGTGADQTSLIDGDGLQKAVAAAEQADVRRFVLVSAFPEAGRDRDTTDGFEHYMRVKKAADVTLAASDLDWVIVRPGTLRDEQGDGRVTAGPAIAYGDVSRDNVAAFLAAVLPETGLTRVIVELTDGVTPVDEAVRTLVR